MNERPTTPMGTASRLPGGRKSLLVFAAVAAAAGLVILVVASQTPSPTLHTTPVVRDSAIALNGGLANAVYFPFQPTPAPGVSGQPSAGNFSTLTGSVSVVGCSVTGPCPTVMVEILSSAALPALRDTGEATPIWCYSGSSGCTASTSATFSVDVTPEAGQMLDLLVYSPSSSSTALTVSASVSLEWTST